MSLATSVVLAVIAIAGLVSFARHVAAHVHQPPVHPNGRCPICGLYAQEQTR